MTETQIKYAAADAHAAIRIFVDVINDRNGTFWKWLNVDDTGKVWRNINDICWKFADVGFKTKPNPKNESK